MEDLLAEVLVLLGAGVDLGDLAEAGLLGRVRAAALGVVGAALGRPRRGVLVALEEEVCWATSSGDPWPASVSVVLMALSPSPSPSRSSGWRWPVPSGWGSAPSASRLTGASEGGRTSSSMTGVMKGGSSSCS